MRLAALLPLLAASLVTAGECPYCYDTDDDFYTDTLSQQRCVITDRVFDRTWDVIIANDHKWDYDWHEGGCGNGFEDNLKGIRNEHGKVRKNCTAKDFICEKLDDRGTVRLRWKSGDWKDGECPIDDVMWAINRASYGNIDIGDIECTRSRFLLPPTPPRFDE